eukprot:gnl/TRDRNA2_/TRDRNA2_190558_c0_seq1.p1 gnl/TRDRNA2_/TRDRNA2_190558_c0~~gnl/TRDRNA2_/TRDRNA2_190558_c0_seq1.p1  ORF type:complete len:454 (+),score=80.97 gnl/TRDRNA2_/TRDRNA2_190558_c0_seq1:89-1450(+)
MEGQPKESDINGKPSKSSEESGAAVEEDPMAPPIPDEQPMAVIKGAGVPGGGVLQGACSKTQARPEVVEAFCNAVLTDSFWECFERRPLHVRRAAPRLAELVDLDDLLDAYLQGGEAGSTNAYKQGEPYTRENLYLAYLDGAVLFLNEAERYWSPLLQICQALVPSFDYVTARLVLSPPGAPRGPPLNTDSDILAVQLAGEQRLTLMPMTEVRRVSAMRPKPLLEADVRPGDALYLPRGVECQMQPAQASAGPTLYALLTVQSAEQNLGFTLGKYLNDLLRSKLSTEADALMRSSITRRSRSSDTTEDVRADLQADLMRHVTELASKVNGADVREHYKQRMEALRQEQADGAIRLPLDQLAQEFTVRTNSLVAVARGVVCQCEAGGTTALFKRGDDTLALPIGRSASHMISEIADGRPHPVFSLTCEDPVERLCVCQVLCGKECLEIVGVVRS